MGFPSCEFQFSKAIDDSSSGKSNGQSRLWELPGIADSNRSGRLEFERDRLYVERLPLTVTSGVDNARTWTVTSAQRSSPIPTSPMIEAGRPNKRMVAAFCVCPQHDRYVRDVGPGCRPRSRLCVDTGYASFDFGLFKRYSIAEQVNATFRFEAFNAFNRVNLGTPSVALDSGTFTRITSSYDNRILQLAFRLNW